MSLRDGRLNCTLWRWRFSAGLMVTTLVVSGFVMWRRRRPDGVLLPRVSRVTRWLGAV